jgi:hypothetical protein
MTTVLNGVLIIAAEPDDKCELCGAIAETRPYGPNGARICHPCGMLDEFETTRQMLKVWGWPSDDDSVRRGIEGAKRVREALRRASK